MKSLTLILATLLVTLTACGAPFDAGEFTEGAGQAGTLVSAGGSVSAAGGAGVIGLGRAGSAAQAGGGGGAGALAGAAGDAGAPQAGAGAGGGMGLAGHAGAGDDAGGASGSGGAGGVMNAAGSGGSGAPPILPCADPRDVAGGDSGALGAGEVCLRTTEKFSTVGCSSFAGRTLKVNGALAVCGAPVPFAPIGGYSYFEISAGGAAYASINWF